MAQGMFGFLVCLLLFIISLQLRGLRKQLQTLPSNKVVPNTDAELPLEAWLQELEAKGAEILQQLENERRAVDDAKRSVQQAGVADASAAGYHTPEVPLAPDAVGEEGVQVQSWVRKPTPSVPVGRTKGNHANRPGTHRQMGQDWQDMQRRVVELAEQGASDAAIARNLGVGQGEVQLILRKTNSPAGKKSADRP